MQRLKIDLKNDQDFLSIKNILKPYTRRAYLVGGCVRNSFLDLSSDDYDIEIYDIEPKLFDELMQKLGANGVGKSFFVYKYKKFDLALARYENKISTGHRGFEVKVCNDEQEGAKRRDFTINALMVNIFDFEFLDFFNGLQDLQAKIIKHIDDKSFVEDSLRVLRGISFACRFDLTIAKESLKLMQTMDIGDLSKERINNELYKIFKTSRLNKAYEYFKILNLEEKIFFHQSCNKEFERLLEQSQKIICDEALFLYLYLNFFHINKEDFFKKTKLKKELLKKCEQEFILGKIDVFDLAKIALKIPLCKWLGLWDDERMVQARKLNLYHHTFESKVSANDLLKEGFSGKELGIELEKRRLQELKNYIKEQK
ncbi:multifunctional tRNA nucleotidyl transferase / 2'3'-cyclic phosphodiesterase / 2'nucleotidase / phosphatase [Campylobacter lari]|uniref:CCA tRNA nucleotidyltransferase n=1 Tax=Campylobacter lari TaxID=201 RepID=UPI0021533FD0|nr:CCA tRNA nucleotidyltransferase [Campylobacter lari]MCR6530514.1 CCA tRNA nucleotidyltransferase [Campylobacter lari]